MRTFGCAATLSQLLLIQKQERVSLDQAKEIAKNQQQNITLDQNLLSLEDVINSFTHLSSEEMQGANSQLKKLEAVQLLYEQCSHGLEMKYLVRCLNPATGLRIGLSSKSMEKVFLEHVKDQDLSGEIIGDFEKNVFGYRIQKDGLSYNLPYKAMVGRPVKTPQEGYKHFVTQKLKGKKVKATGDEDVDIIAEVKYDGERT